MGASALGAVVDSAGGEVIPRLGQQHSRNDEKPERDQRAYPFPEGKVPHEGMPE